MANIYLCTDCFSGPEYKATLCESCSVRNSVGSTLAKGVSVGVCVCVNARLGRCNLGENIHL